MLGSTVDEVVHALLSNAVPEVFDKFALAAYPVKGGEAEALLTSTNLSGLPAVVYESGGMGLVVRRGGRYEINLDAPAAREVMDFIQQRHALGETVTGRALEDHFTGGRYGWDLDIIMLITAALFRGAAIEMTVQGQRVRTPSDPGAREPFTKVPHFRSASFLLAVTGSPSKISPGPIRPTGNSSGRRRNWRRALWQQGFGSSFWRSGRGCCP